MNLSFQEIRKAPFTVKSSIKNLKKTYAMQLHMAKLQDSLTENEPIENMQAISDSLQATVDYVVDVLKLKPNEVEKLEELDQEELMALAQRLNLRIMGMSEQEIEDIQNESDEEGLEQAQANE